MSSVGTWVRATLDSPAWSDTGRKAALPGVRGWVSEGQRAPAVSTTVERGAAWTQFWSGSRPQPRSPEMRPRSEMMGSRRARSPWEAPPSEPARLPELLLPGAMPVLPEAGLRVPRRTPLNLNKLPSEDREADLYGRKASFFLTEG